HLTHWSASAASPSSASWRRDWVMSRMLAGGRNRLGVGRPRAARPRGRERPRTGAATGSVAAGFHPPRCLRRVGGSGTIRGSPQDFPHRGPSRFPYMKTISAKPDTVQRDWYIVLPTN